MADALSEVASELKSRQYDAAQHSVLVAHCLPNLRRYIPPVIRDTTTGRVYTAAELDRIPKGVDPAALSPNKKREDIGEFICKPVLPWIPAWVRSRCFASPLPGGLISCLSVLARAQVHPNMITFTNHVANWVVLLVALVIWDVNEWHRLLGFFVCAIVNFACMMLDCLDGMHARRTKQCSKVRVWHPCFACRPRHRNTPCALHCSWASC